MLGKNAAEWERISEMTWKKHTIKDKGLEYVTPFQILQNYDYIMVKLACPKLETKTDPPA